MRPRQHDRRIRRREKELLEKPVSKALEEIMENRRAVRTDSGSRAPRPVESAEDHAIAVAAPILAEGDVLGCVSSSRTPALRRRRIWNSSSRRRWRDSSDGRWRADGEDRQNIFSFGC